MVISLYFSFNSRMVSAGVLIVLLTNHLPLSNISNDQLWQYNRGSSGSLNHFFDGMGTIPTLYAYEDPFITDVDQISQ